MHFVVIVIIGHNIIQNVFNDLNVICVRIYPSCFGDMYTSAMYLNNHDTVSPHSELTFVQLQPLLRPCVLITMCVTVDFHL